MDAWMRHAGPSGVLLTRGVHRHTIIALQRTPRKVRAWGRVCWLLAVSVSGCSLVNAIDVCERGEAAIEQINRRTEGRQRVAGAGSVVAMPFGGALVAWVSDVSADPSDARTDIRVALVSATGTPIPTCDAPAELTLAPARTPHGSFEVHAGPSLVAPPTEDGVGALVYSRTDDDSSQAWVQFIRGSACPNGTALTPVQVSDESAGTCQLLRDPNTTESRCVYDVRSALLGERPGGGTDFVIAWIAAIRRGVSSQQAIRARVLRARFGGHEFLTAGESISTEPITLRESNALRSMRLIALSGERVGMLWQEDSRTRWQVYDDRLRPTTDPVTLSEADAGLPIDTSVDAAVTATGHVAVVWTERGDDTRSTWSFLTIDEGGRARHAVRTFVPPMGNARRPAITSLGAHGFLVAWEVESSEGEDLTSSLEAVRLGAGGEVLFSNPACAATSFAPSPRRGAQSRVGLATSASGAVLAAWTQDGQSGAFGLASVHSALWHPRRLIPTEE